MSDFLKTIKADFTRKALWDICKYAVLALLLGLWSYVGAEKGAIRFDGLKPFARLLAATTSILIVLGCGELYRRRRRFTPTFGRLDFDFILLRREIDYIRNSDGTIEYRRRFKLKALKNGLDTYTDKYHWTGTGDSEPRAGIKGQTVYKTRRKNVWQVYEICFQKTLNRGDVIDIEIIWTLNDVHNTAVPFFSATIEEPTHLLRLPLQLPPELQVTEAIKEVSQGFSAKKPFISESVMLDRRGEAVFEIPNPQLFHHYELKWNY